MEKQINDALNSEYKKANMIKVDYATIWNRINNECSGCKQTNCFSFLNILINKKIVLSFSVILIFIASSTYVLTHNIYTSRNQQNSNAGYTFSANIPEFVEWNGMTYTIKAKNVTPIAVISQSDLDRLTQNSSPETRDDSLLLGKDSIGRKVFRIEGENPSEIIEVEFYDTYVSYLKYE